MAMCSRKTMKSPLKLRRYITIFLAGITLVMIGAYSVIVQYSLSSAFNDAVLYDLTFKARNFAQTYRKNANTPLPATRLLSIYTNLENIPQGLKTKYGKKDFVPGKVLAADLMDSQTNDDGPLFLMAIAYDLHDGKRIYLVETYGKADLIPGMFKGAARAAYATVGMGLGFICLIVFVLRYFFSRLSSPINALLQWATALDRETLARPHPDFRFEEINQLADLIQKAINQQNQALIREHQFLSHASHELRTPIAVIQTNLDLLHRMDKTGDDSSKLPYQRIKRATENMQRLTETLLWLSRKAENMPKPESIDIKQMINRLIGANDYLLSGKSVDLELDLNASTVFLPKISLEIVLGNLIRNAFQYTGHGVIQVKVSQGAVQVENRDAGDGEQISPGPGCGAGLGLMLVAQICQKLGLQYKNEPIEGGHKAVVLFPFDVFDDKNKFSVKPQKHRQK